MDKRQKEIRELEKILFFHMQNTCHDCGSFDSFKKNGVGDCRKFYFLATDIYNAGFQKTDVETEKEKNKDISFEIGKSISAPWQFAVYKVTRKKKYRADRTIGGEETFSEMPYGTFETEDAARGALRITRMLFYKKGVFLDEERNTENHIP